MDEELFAELMHKPYRAWIEYYLKIMKPEEIDRFLDEIIGQLPDNVYDCMPSFMNDAMKFLVNQPRSWDLPGPKVASLISAIADEKIPPLLNATGDEQDSLYGTLFDVVTVFLSVRAAASDELRQLMGLL